MYIVKSGLVDHRDEENHKFVTYYFVRSMGMVPNFSCELWKFKFKISFIHINVQYIVANVILEPGLGSPADS